ncbi:exported hypothetical protein [Candidatus Sulfotelmatobacter sp. SbA7]|nr:exported hypothetical protein [Candidatus Sulfotelmatobacter sp. SbA7]
MNRPLWKACEEVCLAGLCKKTNIRVAVLLAACLSPILAFAQNDNWLGGTGLWSDATKWSAGVPTSSNSVFIDNGKAGASPVTINFNGAQCANLTIDSDDSLTLVDGTIFTLYGPTISNAGNIFLNSAGFGLDFNFGGAVTLTGAGTLTMSNFSTNAIMGYAQPSPGASLTNKSTIQGAGGVGGAGGIGNGNSFINQGKVNANQTTPLTIIVGSGTVANTGTLEATSGATLALDDGTITNTGGTIHADPASIVSLYDLTVSGGTLTTTGSGIIEAVCCLGYSTLNGVTLNGNFSLVGNNIGFLEGTITDNGSILITPNATLDIVGAVPLKGSGSLTMSNTSSLMAYAQASPGASLTNQITIQGAGERTRSPFREREGLAVPAGLVPAIVSPTKQRSTPIRRIHCSSTPAPARSPIPARWRPRMGRRWSSTTVHSPTQGVSSTPIPLPSYRSTTQRSAEAR